MAVSRINATHSVRPQGVSGHSDRVRQLVARGAQLS